MFTASLVSGFSSSSLENHVKVKEEAQEILLVRSKVSQINNYNLHDKLNKDMDCIPGQFLLCLCTALSKVTQSEITETSREIGVQTSHNNRVVNEVDSDYLLN